MTQLTITIPITKRRKVVLTIEEAREVQRQLNDMFPAMKQVPEGWLGQKSEIGQYNSTPTPPWIKQNPATPIPCLFDGVSPQDKPLTMGLACNCPKCSPQCTV